MKKKTAKNILSQESYSLNRIFKELVFPVFSDPIVSIIIPCHNQINFTYNLLFSILKNISLNLEYEIVLIDDFSNDETAHIENYIKNIKIIHNNKNLFFLKSCNNAVKIAKGKYLFFLNNDTFFYKNTLDYLIETIENNSFIGIVGSKVINEDDSVQEAGQVIFNDGDNYAYGLNKNLNFSEYNYLKEVDYISFCSALIRKDLFVKLNGFDEKYCPMYSEDSDLCFRVRSLGYKIVYQPKSIVKHYGKISSKKSHNSLKKYFLSLTDLNKWKFYITWKNILLNEHISKKSKKKYLFFARDRSFNKKLIFIISDFNSILINKLPNCLNTNYNIKFISDDFLFKKNNDFIDILEQKGIEVFYGENYKNNWEKILKKYSKFTYKIFMKKTLNIKLHFKKDKICYFTDNSISF